MSPRTPRLTAKQIIKQPKNSGFIEIGQTGSHSSYSRKLVAPQLFQFIAAK